MVLYGYDRLESIEDGPLATAAPKALRTLAFGPNQAITSRRMKDAGAVDVHLDPVDPFDSVQWPI
jgi:hypothetical protein